MNWVWSVVTFVTSNVPRNSYNYCNNIHPSPGWARQQCLPNSVTCPSLLPPPALRPAHIGMLSPLSLLSRTGHLTSPHLPPSHSSPRPRAQWLTSVSLKWKQILPLMSDSDVGSLCSLVAISAWLSGPAPAGWDGAQCTQWKFAQKQRYESLRPGRGGARPVSGPRVQPGLSPAHFKYFLDGISEHSAELQTHKAENLIMFLDCKISWTDPDVRDTCHVSCKIVNVPQRYIPWQTVVSHDTWVLVDSVHKWRVYLAFGWNMVRCGKINAARINWNLEKLWNQRVYLNHGKYFVNYFSDIDWHFYS